MAFFHRKLIFATELIFLSLALGCGGSEEEEVVVAIPDSPPQITITLRSDITLEQPLEPDPQFDKSAAIKKGGKKRAILGRKDVPLPAFKADVEYQSIDRFEKMAPASFEISFEKKPPKKQIRKTVKLQDKPLVFAGRGFNIEAFDHAVNPAVEVDYVSHLREPPKRPLAIGVADHLDLNGEYSKDTKNLIYSATRAAFGKMPPPLVELEPVEPKTQFAGLVEKNPDSILRFPPGEESIAVVARDEKRLDLLIGNESLNKKRFRSE
ncbi:MAG: hypothetical protein ACI8PD_002273 [Nitrospinales bacterium]|jgi:hypothetical protein